MTSEPTTGAEQVAAAMADYQQWLDKNGAGRPATPASMGEPQGDAERAPVDVEAIRARLDAATPEPMTDRQLASMRRRVDAFTGSDHYRYTVDGIEYDAHWGHDTRRLLDALAARDASIAVLSARIDAKSAELDRVIREAAADKARLDAENTRCLRIIEEITADNAGLTSCLDAVRAEAQKMLAEHGQSWNSISGRRIMNVFDAAPGMPHPPAQDAAPAVSAATGSTGVPGPENVAQAVELVPGVWISSARQNGKTTQTITAAVESSKPGHYREAADALDNLGVLLVAEEQRCQAAINEEPLNPHLHGMMSGLQRARDIVTGDAFPALGLDQDGKGNA